MANVLVPLANGFEEIEAVTIIDVLRRAGVVVTVAGLADGPARGSHDIVLEPDTTLDAVRAASFDAVVLPGGMPGAKHLSEDPRVLEIVRRSVESGRLTAAICAAPIVLEAAGVLKGVRATSYPGHALPSARYSEDSVVEDGVIVTSRAAGTAMEFALALVTRLVSPAKARELTERMLVERLA